MIVHKVAVVLINVSTETLRIGTMVFEPSTPVVILKNPRFYLAADFYKIHEYISMDLVRAVDFNNYTLTDVEFFADINRTKSEVESLSLDAANPDLYWYDRQSKFLKGYVNQHLDSFDWSAATVGKMETFKLLSDVFSALFLGNFDLLTRALLTLEMKPETEFISPSRISAYIACVQSMTVSTQELINIRGGNE